MKLTTGPSFCLCGCWGISLLTSCVFSGAGPGPDPCAVSAVTLARHVLEMVSAADMLLHKPRTKSGAVLLAALFLATSLTPVAGSSYANSTFHDEADHQNAWTVHGDECVEPAFLYDLLFVTGTADAYGSDGCQRIRKEELSLEHIVDTLGADISVAYRSVVGIGSQLFQDLLSSPYIYPSQSEEIQSEQCLKNFLDDLSPVISGGGGGLPPLPPECTRQRHFSSLGRTNRVATVDRERTWVVTTQFR